MPAHNDKRRVLKKLYPGQHGTQRWQDRYGNQLLCVRYSETEDGERLTTVELIVDKRPSPNEIVSIKVAIEETQLRTIVKEHGAKWNPQTRLWQLPRQMVKSLKLQHRIVKSG